MTLVLQNAYTRSASDPSADTFVSVAESYHTPPTVYGAASRLRVHECGAPDTYRVCFRPLNSHQKNGRLRLFTQLNYHGETEGRMNGGEQDQAHKGECVFIH